MKISWKKNTAIFLCCQAISILGSSLVQFAITAYIAMQTKSGLLYALGVLCAILPTFFLSPFAGVWADRFNRKHLIMIADGCIAACTLIVAVVFLLGFESIWILFVALIIRALGSAVQSPCVGALLPDIVPEEHLGRVNGINSSMQSLFALASPMLGAMLLPLVPLGVIFFIDIITAGVAIVILLTAFVLPKKERKAPSSASYLFDLKQVARYIRANKYLTQFFVISIIFFIMMAPAAFLNKIQVARNYAGGSNDYWGLSAIEVAFSLGMVIGGIGISLWGGLRNRVHTIMLSTACLGVCSLAFGFKMPFALYVTFMLIFGMALPMLNTAATTMIQERVDPQYMGRIFSVVTMLNTSMMSLGMIIFGPLADLMAVEIIMLFAGIVVLLATFFISRLKALLAAGARGEPAGE